MAGSQVQKSDATSAKLIRLTIPIAVSEVLWGASSFIYALVFVRLGTDALAASQIVMTIENIFIVAAAGLGPAAVAAVGQKLGTGSVPAAKQHANVVLKLGLITSVVLGILFAGSQPFRFRALSQGRRGSSAFCGWWNSDCCLFSAGQSSERDIWQWPPGNGRRYQIRSDGKSRWELMVLGCRSRSFSGCSRVSVYTASSLPKAPMRSQS